MCLVALLREYFVTVLLFTVFVQCANEHQPFLGVNFPKKIFQGIYYGLSYVFVESLAQGHLRS